MLTRPPHAAAPKQVKAEIAYNARRIGAHASLAIWGGGNEVEASFRWFPDSRDDPQGFTDDYMRLFVYTIREALLAIDPAMNFVDSSPSNQIKGTDPYAKRCARAQPASCLFWHAVLADGVNLKGKYYGDPG